MSFDPIDRLTEAQREVLRRWNERQSAKEIARDLGITHWAVNERLRAARRTLGAASSQEAAKMLAEAEGYPGYNGAYKGVVYDPLQLAGEPDFAIMAGSEDDRDWSSGSGHRNAVREEQVAYRVTAPLWPGLRLPIPHYEGDRNELGVQQRLLWIGALAIAIIVAVGTLITISTGVVRLVSEIVQLRP